MRKAEGNRGRPGGREAVARLEKNTSDGGLHETTEDIVVADHAVRGFDLPEEAFPLLWHPDEVPAPLHGKDKATIEGVANVWTPVEDIDRAKEFHRSVLELPVVKDEGEWVEFDANGVRIGLDGREPHGTYSEGGPHAYLPAGAGARRGRRGPQASGRRVSRRISDHDRVRVATFKDSESNDVQLCELPKD